MAIETRIKPEDVSRFLIGNRLPIKEGDRCTHDTALPTVRSDH
jgi:hypothetical protein